MSASYFFILNSRIGVKKIQQVEDALAEHFSTEKTYVGKTKFGGHATSLCKQALEEGYTHVVAVGGDGTVNEIIQVLANTQVILAIVPCGSGNGLARHCGIPLAISEAVRNVLDGHSVCIDLGKANNIYFISNAGVGIDALVCADIKNSTKRGLKMYVWYVAKRYLTYKPELYDIRIDDSKTVQRRGFFMNIANGKQFGYGFEIAPEASLQDGMLDLIVVQRMGIMQSIKFVWDGWRKKLIYNKHCLYERGEVFQVKADALSYFQADGDAHQCEGICTFRIMKDALHLMIPEHIRSI
ncbi:MAG: diacylglycerol kinase family lipid kinase [Chitinophagaceae bacterium]|nr:diacylglycerol kinase family lipid kinase [Chitinophagaceae bacterium]